MENAYLRKANEKDIDLLYEWANEEMVRKNSFHTEKISYQEHVQWFQRMTEQIDKQQYIYIYDGKPIGQVRIEIEGKRAEIGYSVCLEQRCMGHGKRILHLIAEQVQIDFPNVEILAAKVKPDNVASKEAFLKMGYSHIYEEYRLNINEIVQNEKL